MPSNSPTYRVLFLLQHPAFTFLEIERLGLSKQAPKSEVYRWLRYEVATNSLTALDFIGMHSAPPLEERQFRQGTLRFSAEAGTFWPAEAPDTALPLVPTPSLLVAPALAAQVAALLALVA